MFGDLVTPAVKQFGDRYTSVLPDVVARLSAPPFTLSHGDYRADNFFFGDDDLSVCDWQLVDRSRGARDLAYLLSQSTTSDVRAERERSLVERYASRLAARGVDDYGAEVLWDDYRLATAFAFVYPVVAGGGLEHADDRSRTLTRAMFRRSIEAIESLRALDLI
jgi:aminoglycoside phosphotransferase (APT) family kinase protein